MAESTRRSFLARVASLGALAAAAPKVLAAPVADKYDPDGPVARYPNTDVVVLDKRFRYLRVASTPIVRLHRGTLWAEGPAWNGAGRYLVWSDIPNDEQLRWCEEDGHVSRRFRYPSNHSNGNTFDHQGRQISFEHGTRRVVRYELDGTCTILAPAIGSPVAATTRPATGAPGTSITTTGPSLGTATSSWLGTRAAADARTTRMSCGRRSKR